MIRRLCLTLLAFLVFAAPAAAKASAWETFLGSRMYRNSTGTPRLVTTGRKAACTAARSPA